MNNTTECTWCSRAVALDMESVLNNLSAPATVYLTRVTIHPLCLYAPVPNAYVCKCKLHYLSSIVCSSEENRDILTRSGFMDKCGKEWLFPSIHDAVHHAKFDRRLVRILARHTCAVLEGT